MKSSCLKAVIFFVLLSLVFCSNVTYALSLSINDEDGVVIKGNGLNLQVDIMDDEENEGEEENGDGVGSNVLLNLDDEEMSLQVMGESESIINIESE